MIETSVTNINAAHSTAVRELHLAAAAIEGSGLARAPDEITAEHVQGFLRRGSETGVALGAFIEDRLVGEIHATRLGPRQFDHVLTELAVAVHPDVQGLGVGSALFAGLFERTGPMTPRIHRIELIARSGNVGALRLYRRLGFIEEGRLVGRVILPDGSREDDVIMAKVD